MASTEGILLRWRQIVEAGRKRGHSCSEPDVLIAASALVEQLVVVSWDVGEFVEGRAPVPVTARFRFPGQPSRTLESLDRDGLLEGIGRDEAAARARSSAPPLNRSDRARKKR